MKQLVQKSKNLIEISYVQGVRSDKTNQREINAGLVEIIYQSKQWNHCCHGRTLRRQKFTIIRCFGKFRKLSQCEKSPNTEFFLVRIWTEYEKIRIRTRENSVFGYFSHSICCFKVQWITAWDNSTKVWKLKHGSVTLLVFTMQGAMGDECNFFMSKLR